jgi:hypothetical protein
MTAAEILAIKYPEKLFAVEASLVKKEYHDLSKKWHPDVCKDKQATEVFSHIARLYAQAEIRITNDEWRGQTYIRIVDKSGKGRNVKYHTASLFELGTCYLGTDSVTYVLDKEHKDLWQNAINAIVDFPFSSDQMKKEISPYLPMNFESFETEADRLVLHITKRPELIRLRDVLEHYDGHIDAKHVAWIQNRLHNFACYLHAVKLCHNEISPDTVFIDPADHSLAVLGGWWYSKAAGAPIAKVSKRTHGLLPWKVKVTKRASRKTDMELVKATGREILGPGSSAPVALMDCLGEVAQKDAFAAYKEWNEVLLKSFGPKRFTVMDLKPSQIYPVG